MIYDNLNIKIPDYETKITVSHEPRRSVLPSDSSSTHPVTVVRYVFPIPLTESVWLYHLVFRACVDAQLGKPHRFATAETEVWDSCPQLASHAPSHRR
jgi:hypothetical protein